MFGFENRQFWFLGGRRMDQKQGSPTEVDEHDVHNLGGEMAEALAGQDYTTSLVPLNRRRSNWVMFWLWVTFQASVAYMYTGYLARSQGLSLGEMIVAGFL